MNAITNEIGDCALALRNGNVIAYPTEAVYGLGCDPFNETAVAHLFALKQRPAGQGVLLIAANYAQIESFIGAIDADALARIRATWPGPHTWIFPRSATTPTWLARGHEGIALRVTAHPQAAALCETFGGALVSTSANRHGMQPARTASEVQTMFAEDELAYILDGATGGLERPTPIRDAMTGKIIRS